MAFIKTGAPRGERVRSLRERPLKPYFLDEASVIAAKTLDVHPGEYVLDLCAAPGGKTLVLAPQLSGEGVLVANERSRTRRARLIKVPEEHLPEKTADMVTVTGYDAKTWGLYQKNRYDKVLLDVPCASERHVLNSPRYSEREGTALYLQDTKTFLLTLFIITL